MFSPAGELPDQPTVHGPESQLPPSRALPRPGHVVQDPSDLAAGEIGVNQQAGAVLDHLLAAIRLEPVTKRCGAAVLPEDRVVDGLTRCTVPDDGCLALIRDAYGSNIARSEVCPAKSLSGDTHLGSPKFVWIMLYPAGFGEDSAKFLSRNRVDPTVVVKQDRTRTGRALIERKNIGQCNPLVNFTILSPEERSGNLPGSTADTGTEAKTRGATIFCPFSARACPRCASCESALRFPSPACASCG